MGSSSGSFLLFLHDFILCTSTATQDLMYLLKRVCMILIEEHWSQLAPDRLPVVQLRRLGQRSSGIDVSSEQSERKNINGVNSRRG